MGEVLMHDLFIPKKRSNNENLDSILLTYSRGIQIYLFFCSRLKDVRLKGSCYINVHDHSTFIDFTYICKELRLYIEKTF